MALDPFIQDAALLIFAVLLIVSAAEDVRRLIIPNRYCLAIAFLFPAYLLAAPAPVDWQGAAAVAAASLAVGFVFFAMRVAGGGDVKLFAATALWAGPSLFPEFLMVTSVIGAGIGLALLAHRRLVRVSAAAVDAPAEARKGLPPIPYGVAIAVGGLHVAAAHFLKG